MIQSYEAAITQLFLCNQLVMAIRGSISHAIFPYAVDALLTVKTVGSATRSPPHQPDLTALETCKIMLRSGPSVEGTFIPAS